MTYYEILEISEKASQEVIRMAYKALCKKYHPDVYQGDKNFAEEKMKQINEAYETLSDETKKRQYDYTINIQARRTQNTYQASKQSNYQPKQENKTEDIEVSLKRGFMALAIGDWIKATLYFERVLNQNVKSAEAYLGKLMIELQIKTRENLKNCAQPFNDRPNYQKAFTYADDSLKQFLKETIQHINKRNYETECQKKYQKACAFMLQNDGIQCFQNAIAEFEKIREYKDSAKKIEECYKKIAEINSAILAAEAEKEKLKEERKEKFKAKLPFIKKVSLIVVPLVALAVIAASALPKINWSSENTVDSSSNEVITSDVTTSENLSSENSSSFVSNEAASKVSSSTINSSSTNNHSSSPSPSTSVPSTNEPTTSTPSASTSTSSRPELFKYTDVVNITEGDFSYKLVYATNSPIKVTLTKYKGVSSNVNIPSTIKGYKITTIGELAFDCSSVKTVTIPNTVTTIENYAFNQCSLLTSILIPESVKTIGGHVFNECTSLTSVSLPNSITSLGEAVPTTSQVLPSIAPRIGGTFFNCTSLTSVTIPNGITNLEEYTFAGCSSLPSIIIPNTVTYISDTAFSRCSALTKVYFNSESQKNKFAEVFDWEVELIVLE